MNEFLNKYINTDQLFTFVCTNYIYSGQIDSIYADMVVLSNAEIVFETGPLNEKGWRNSEKLPTLVCITKQSIESIAILNK